MEGWPLVLLFLHHQKKRNMQTALTIFYAIFMCRSVHFILCVDISFREHSVLFYTAACFKPCVEFDMHVCGVYTHVL